MSNDYINSYEKKKEISGKGNRYHPIWNGVGCALIVLVPVFSLILARFLINQFVYIQKILQTNYFFSKSVSLLDWDEFIIFFIPNTKEFFITLRTSLNIQPITYFWGALLIGLGISFVIFSIISISYSMTRRKSNIYKKSPIDIVLDKQMKKEKRKSKK
jgi:hypothetical protein